MMIEMSPYYAYESPVGPVFEVATWSPRKALTMAIVCLIGGIAFAGAAAYAWNPNLLSAEPFEVEPFEVLKGLNEEIADLKKEHSWATRIGIGFLGLIGFVGLAGACSSVVDFFRGDYYFRAGAGGISVRVPNGLDLARFGLVSRVLQLDLPGAEIDDWVIVQRKQAGSLSPNAGNISAHLKLKTVGGKKHEFSLDYFREPARIISRKIEDALQMVPASLGPDSETSTTTVRGAEGRLDTIFTALDRLLSRTGDNTSVVIADPTTSKFVQFASIDGKLLFDLPAQTLDEIEMLRAVEYFRQIGREIKEYQLLDAPGGERASAGRSFQMNLADNAEAAARLAVDIFDAVYRLPADSTLVVEET